MTSWRRGLSFGWSWISLLTPCQRACMKYSPYSQSSSVARLWISSVKTHGLIWSIHFSAVWIRRSYRSWYLLFTSPKNTTRDMSEHHHWYLTHTSISTHSHDWRFLSVGVWCRLTAFSWKAMIGGKLISVIHNLAASWIKISASSISVIHTVMHFRSCSYDCSFYALCLRNS